MQLQVPDPDYTGSSRAVRSFWLAIKLVFGLLIVIWSVFLFERLLGIELSQFGLRPRDSMGLLGLLTTPLLHGNLNHLLSNSVPLFVGGVAMLFIYPVAALRALPAIYVGSSALAWLFARSSLHIGASGLVYGILTFVFVSGLLRRDIRSVGVSLMIWFLYGSMIWGVLPVRYGMSWELHLSGALVGLLMAVLFRNNDRPPVKRYDWEDDEAIESVVDEESDQPWRNDRWR